MPGAVQEFAYLTAHKADVYRQIMRFVYEQHLTQHHTLPPEDITQAVQLPEYTTDACLADLEQLIQWATWGNAVTPDGSQR